MKNYYGICEWAFPVSGPLSIQLASLAGFDGIQLGECGGSLSHFPLCQSYIQNAYLEASKKYNVILHSLNLGALLQSMDIFYAPETYRGNQAALSILKGIEAAHALKINRIVITVSPDSEEAFKNALIHLNFACIHAEIYNIKIVVETNLSFTGIQKLLEECKGAVSLCMDTLNPLRFHSGSPLEQIRAFHDSIDHYHMKDSISSLFQPDQRGCVLLGSGDACYLTVAEEIKKTSYKGWFFSENYYYLSPLNKSGDFLAYAKKDLQLMHAVFDGSSENRIAFRK